MKIFLSIVFALLFAVSASAQSMGVSGGNVPRYVPNAWNFDGSQTIRRSSDFDNNVDGQLGIISFWYRNDVANGNQIALSAQSSDIEVLNDTSGLWTIIMRDAGGTDVVTMTTQNIFHDGDGEWHHFLASWNTGTDTFHFYISDVENLSGARNATDNDIDYTGSPHDISGVSGTQEWQGCLADVYINYGEFLDFSIVANRRKFIDVNGDPVLLRNDGSGPTGNQPTAYLKNPSGSVTANSGAGGDYNTNGGVTACSNNP